MEKIKKINDKIKYLDYQSADNSYKENLNSINEKIVELKQLLKLHSDDFNKDTKNYGYAGDLGYVLEQLKEAVNFLKNEE